MGVLFDKGQSILVAYPGGKAANYVVPDRVTSIDVGAFYGCTSLTSVSIPNSVTNIGLNAFTGCSSLTAINVDTFNPVYSSVMGVLFDKSQSSLIAYPGGKAGNYVIPDGVAYIGEDAFSGCTNLTSVTIPNSVNQIRSYAFEGCSDLTQITIPDNVRGIQAYVFSGCISLTSVTIGSKVTGIGPYAFDMCSNLAGVYFKGNAPSIDYTAFDSGSPTVYYLPGTAGWGMTFAGFPAALWLPQVEINDTTFGIRNNQFGFNITWAPTGLLWLKFPQT